MNDEQLLRYSRHILLNEVGVEGQDRLHAAHALVIGAGGLGSPAALYLASAGIGTLTLVDGDRVDLTNLQRQILHTSARIGMPKAASGRMALAAINPDVNLVPVEQHVDTDRLRGPGRTRDRGSRLLGQFRDASCGQPVLRDAPSPPGLGRCHPLRRTGRLV